MAMFHRYLKLAVASHLSKYVLVDTKDVTVAARFFQDALSTARPTCLRFQQAEELLGISSRR